MTIFFKKKKRIVSNIPKNAAKEKNAENNKKNK